MYGRYSESDKRDRERQMFIWDFVADTVPGADYGLGLWTDRRIFGGFLLRWEIWGQTCLKWNGYRQS